MAVKNMKSIEKLNFYNYVAKGKKIGEYFFFSGFKIYILQTNKLIRKRNCVETIEGWQFNLVATAKSKFYAEYTELKVLPILSKTKTLAF